MNINEIINNIVNSVDRTWPKLYQIRYAYVELGKYLQKNTDFFFSVDKKLGENNLTYDEIAAIYNEEVVLSTEVICKSASVILKSVLDRLGIQSKLVKSINNVMEYSDGERDLLINHWMLAVNDGENEYFCTLSSDLPYIQMGMETKHFGVNIPYVKELNDGTSIHVYEGEEIKHSVLSHEQLKKIDIDIKYIRDYYRYDESNQVSKDWNLQYSNASLNMLRDSVRGNKLFNDLEINRTDFHNNLMTFKGENDRTISFYNEPISSLTEGDWNKWIKLVCAEVLKKINEILGYDIYPIPPLESRDWNYEAWLLSLATKIENDIYQFFGLYKDEIREIEVQVDNFKYNKWSKKLKQKLDFGQMYDSENLIMILDKMNALVNCIRSKGKNGNINSLFQALSYHFIPMENLYENNIDENGKLSSYYIANKFEEMFEKVFSCNGETTDINRMSYSEQVVIIKEVLTVMFPEITVQNSSMIREYNESYSPVLNRIQLYPIKNKDTGEYSLIFSVISDGDYDDIYFYYDMKTNDFGVCNIFDINDNFIFVSDRMKNRLGIDDLENVEDTDEYDDLSYWGELEEQGIKK